MSHPACIRKYLFKLDNNEKKLMALQTLPGGSCLFTVHCEKGDAKKYELYIVNKMDNVVNFDVKIVCYDRDRGYYLEKDPDQVYAFPGNLINKLGLEIVLPCESLKY